MYSFFDPSVADRGERQTQDLQTLGPAGQAAVQDHVRLPAQLLRRLHPVHGQTSAGTVRPGAGAADVGGTRAQDVHQRRSPSVVVRLPADQVQAQRLHGHTVRVQGRPRQALLLPTILRPADRHAVVRRVHVIIKPIIPPPLPPSPSPAGRGTSYVVVSLRIYDPLTCKCSNILNRRK